MLGLSEPSWKLRSWVNLYPEPPSVLGKNWRDLLAKKLHAEHKAGKEATRFNSETKIMFQHSLAYRGR